MAVLLEGGCRVANMREDAPQVQGELISLRVLEFAPGESLEFRNEDRDEVLFSLGDCTLLIDGVEQRVEPERLFQPSFGTKRDPVRLRDVAGGDDDRRNRREL